LVVTAAEFVTDVDAVMASGIVVHRAEARFSAGAAPRPPAARSRVTWPLPGWRRLTRAARACRQKKEAVEMPFVRQWSDVLRLARAGKFMAQFTGRRC
jgi:hypothetical protein